MINYIKTVAIYVEDQKRSLDFYIMKLGFDVYRNFPMGKEANWIEVAPKGAQSHMVLYPKALMSNWQELKPSIVFSSKDCEATFRELKSRGIEFTQEPERMAWGICAKFIDPDKNEFLITQDLIQD